MNALLNPRVLRALLPPVSFILLLAVIFIVQPRAMSYLGLNLMLNLALPIALATIAQLCVITVNDLDLSIGGFVSLVACIGATVLNETPLLGVLLLVLCIAAYAGIGALIHWRNLPSIVVTLGLSFVWLGAAILLLPSPGGSAPAWLSGLVKLKTPLVPFAILASAALALAVHLLLMRSSFGTVLRGAGGNPQAVRRAGWSLLRAKMTMYALCGFFGVLSG